MSKSFPDGTTRHGTHSGWTRHIQSGEDPCTPCWNARAEYDRRRLTADEQQLLNRARARAQGRATTKLRRMFPEAYRQLYQEAKAEVEEELGLGLGG